jgi:hypothetical protein
MTFTSDYPTLLRGARLAPALALACAFLVPGGAAALSTEPPAVEVDWDSGKTGHLSDWKQVTCAATYGSSYLLTGLKAYQEPKSNLDNFIARLEAECTRYATTNGFTAQVSGGTAQHLDRVFTEDHRTPGTLTHINNAADLPVGIGYRVNAGDDYIKNVSIRIGDPFAAEPDNVTVFEWPSTATPWANDYDDAGINNYVKNLHCPNVHVLTGIGVRHATRNGKIRRLRIFCRHVDSP